MGSELVCKSRIIINAPAARVWKALVDPDITRKYMFDCEAISEWKPGSSLLWKGAVDGKVYVKGNVVDIQQHRILRYTTFDPNGSAKDDPSNYLTVTYTLSETSGTTVLDVSQGDFAWWKTAGRDTRTRSADGIWCFRRSSKSLKRHQPSALPIIW